MLFLKKIFISMSFVHAIAFAQHEQGNIRHNYDYGCEIKQIETKHGDLKVVVCFDQQLNKSSKVYLREKLIIETSDMIIRQLNKTYIDNVYVFEVLKKNKFTNTFESYYYLIDVAGEKGKIFKFGIQNSENLDVKNDSFSGKLKIKINKEIAFVYDKGILSYPLSIKNKVLYIENLSHPSNSFYNKAIKQNDTDIYNTYKPYVEISTFSFDDNKIKYGKNFTIYSEGDYDSKYIKVIETPRGNVKLLEEGNLLYYPNMNEETVPELLNTDQHINSIPGILAVNSEKNLILTYLKYDFNSAEMNKHTFCGNSLALFDFTKKIPQLITFGIFQGCDIFKSVKFIGKREAIIELEPNIIFHYKNGVMRLPKKENYKVILKEQKDNYSYPLRPENSLDINKYDINYVYRNFFPYAKKEKIPLDIADDLSFYTPTGELKFIENYYKYFDIKINDEEIYSGQNFKLKYRDEEMKYFIGNIFSYKQDKKGEKENDPECASSALLIDASFDKPLIFKFGVENACNEIIKVEKSKDKLFVSLNSGNIYEYSDGELKLPSSSSNYKLMFPKSFRSIDTLKTGSELYKKFPPYSFLIEEKFDYK